MRLHALLAASAIASAVMLLPSVAGATQVGTAAGIQKSLRENNVVEQARRVCRHDFWTSRRVCWTDRSRPPTVCHHIRNSSRRDCY